MNLCLLSGGATFGLVDEVKTEFEARQHCRISGQFGAVGAMKDKLLSGDPCDVIILSRKLIDQLNEQGALIQDSIRDVATIGTGIAVIEGEAIAPITDAASFIAALKNASGIYIPDMDKSTAGIHLKKTFRNLDVFDAIKDRIHEFPNGATAMKTMAANAVPHSLGCTQLTEIRYTPGVVAVAPLPAGCALDTVYTAAIPRNSAATDLAGTWIDSLTDASLDGFKRGNGFAK